MKRKNPKSKISQKEVDDGATLESSNLSAVATVTNETGSL
jgi:hypothetical protein